MVTSKSLFATLGVGAVLAVGVLAAGSTPAKADGLRISDHNGRVGFSLNIGGPAYCAPVYAAPVYVAPSYYAPYGRDDHRWSDRDDRGGRGFDRDSDHGRDFRGGHDRR